MKTALRNWFLSRDGARWLGGTAVVCLIIAVLRQSNIENSIGAQLTEHRKFSGAAVDSILGGIEWIKQWCRAHGDSI